MLEFLRHSDSLMIATIVQQPAGCSVYPEQGVTFRATELPVDARSTTGKGLVFCRLRTNLRYIGQMNTWGAYTEESTSRQRGGLATVFLGQQGPLLCQPAPDRKCLCMTGLFSGAAAPDVIELLLQTDEYILWPPSE